MRLKSYDQNLILIKIGFIHGEKKVVNLNNIGVKYLLIVLGELGEALTLF